MPFVPAPTPFARLAVGLVAVATLALAGCGGGSDESTSDSAEIPGDADPEQVEVIDRWSEALAGGDVDAAAEFFAIPSVAQNGGLYEIDSKADARLFNGSLPCGARLVEAQAADEFTIATFELTERPGPGECGSGTGNEASTAFRIVDGEIVEWRRVVPTDDGEPDAPPAPSSSA